MNLIILFFAGLVAGIVVSQIQKTDTQGPVVDIMFGMMGAMLMGGMVSQFTKFNPIILIIAIVGAVLFIEIGRVVPEP